MQSPPFNLLSSHIEFEECSGSPQHAQVWTLSCTASFTAVPQSVESAKSGALRALVSRQFLRHASPTSTPSRRRQAGDG